MMAWVASIPDPPKTHPGLHVVHRHVTHDPHWVLSISLIIACVVALYIIGRATDRRTRVGFAE